MRAPILALALAAASGPALAQATCAPTTQGSILFAPEWAAIHPDWADGSTVGLSWSLDLQGDALGEDGETFLYGDLLDPQGDLVTVGVYVWSMEWECDVY